MLTGKQVLDLNYLDVRCMLVEIAATMDRYDRGVEFGEAKPNAADAERMEKLRQALQLLAAKSAEPNRAERVLLLFSDPA